MNKEFAKTQNSASNTVQSESEQETSSASFSDLRPDAVAQRKVQAAANESPSVKQLQSLQQGASNSPAVKQLKQYQAAADAKTLQKKATPSAPVIQRVIKLKDGYVGPEHHDLFIREVCKIFEHEGLKPTQAQLALLQQWLLTDKQIISADSIAEVAFNLMNYGEDKDKWKDMKPQEIKNEDLLSGRKRKNRERFSKLQEPSTVQIGDLVPSFSKLNDKHLLKLSQKGEEDDENYLRREDNSINLSKKKKLSEKDESRFVVCGDKDDPSYVVWKRNRQHGHRYKGAKNNTNHSKKRTYGSKKDREGIEYKGSGLVDGHSIQAQDDQLILGPYQKDVPNWETTVKSNNGPDLTLDDKKYLPTDDKDKKYIETNPYNFYWENQEQGKHYRQKGIETEALNEASSFLHLNNYKGSKFNPNNKGYEHLEYEIPDEIDYYLDKKGGEEHHIADNRPTADYSNPSKYDKTKNQYGEIKGEPSINKNTDLGGISVKDHLKMSKQSDLSKFPFAKVLYPQKDDFKFEPEYRFDDDDYDSPPPSPYHVPFGLEEKEYDLKGNQKKMLDFEHDKRLVDKFKYDQGKDESKLTTSMIKFSDQTTWSGKEQQFSDLQKKFTGTQNLPSIPQGNNYTPTNAQNQQLSTLGLTLRWVAANGFCIFGSTGAVMGIDPAVVQQTVLNAIDNNTGSIRTWIGNFGGYLYSYDQVRRAVANIATFWNRPIADVILPLIAEVYGIGFTVLNDDGSTTSVNGGGSVIVKVKHPNEHYHATK